jgi:hypothetical protein
MKMRSGRWASRPRRANGFRDSVVALAILTVFLVAISLLTWPARVRANAAEKMPASRSGDGLRDPQGELKSVHIEHEVLLIDMRSLAQGRPVVVEANYQVRNSGEGRAVELVFVAPALTSDLNGGGWVWREAQWVNDERLSPVTEGGVWLDGQAIAGVRPETGDDTLPKDWQPPKATPALGESQKPLPYQATSSSTILFRIDLAPGEHSIRVRYAARPSAYCTPGSPAIYWQLGYVLAPARQWASFGGLDAKVLLPTGWRAAGTPEMKREGESLVGSWTAIPSDTLALTAQTTESVFREAGPYWVTLLFVGLPLAVVLSVISGWLIGRWLGARKRTSAWALLVSPIAGVLFAFLASLVVDFVTAPSAPQQVAFNGVDSPWGGYNPIITFPLLVIIAIVGFVALQGTAFIIAFFRRMRDSSSGPAAKLVDK